MKKIVILGCGYIGANLANYIVENYTDEVYVLGVKNEYSEKLNKKVIFVEKYVETIDSNDCEMFYKAIVIDALGNLNATNNAKSAYVLALQNCESKITMINKLIEFGIEKYIFISSGGTVYFDSSQKHVEDEPLNPQNIYALEKNIIENYLKIISIENKDFKYVIVRLSNPYGGIITKNKKQGIIDVVMTKIMNDEEIEFYGDLDNIRDYIYIDNVTEYIYNLANKDIINDIFNIGLGEGNSVKKIFETIQRITGKKIKMKLKKIDTVNIHCNVLNVNKIKNIIKLKHVYSVEEGIELCFLRYKNK